MRRHTKGALINYVDNSNSNDEIKPKLVRKKLQKKKEETQNQESEFSNTSEKQEKTYSDVTNLEINPNNVTNILIIDTQIKQLLKNEPITLEKYTNATKGIICSWLISVPTFSNQESTQIRRDSKIEDLKKIYLEQAVISGKIKVQQQEIDPNICPACGDEIEDKPDSSTIICICGYSESKFVCGDVANQNGNVIESSPTSQRNLADRLQHLDCLIDILQGTEDYTIPTATIVRLRKKLGDKADKIERSKLLSILEAENTKDSKNLIDHLANVYKRLTGNIVMVIDNALKDRIRARHVEFLLCYHDWKIRTNKIETHLFKATYLLWQYLYMEGKKLDVRIDMPGLKIKDTLDWHNQTMRIICDELNKKPDTKFNWEAEQLYI